MSTSTFRIQCRDELGAPEADVTVEAKLVSPPEGDTGRAYDAAVQSTTSGADGWAEMELVRLATYLYRRGTSGQWHRVTIDDADETIPPSVVG